MSFKPFAHFTILINSPEKKMYMANARPQNGYAKVNLQLDFKSLQCPLMCYYYRSLQFQECFAQTYHPPSPLECFQVPINQ